MSKKKARKEFEERLYKDFLSSQMYRAVNRAGNVVGKIVNEGLDHLEKTDFYKKTVQEQEGRDFVDVPPEDVRETAPEEPAAKTKKKEKASVYTVEETTPVQEQPMKEIRLPSNAPFYALGIAWLAYSLLLPMYRPLDYLIAAGLSLLAFGVSKAVFKGKKVLVPADEPKPAEEPKEEEKPARTGDPEADRLIAEGEKYLQELAVADIRIDNESVSASIRRMEVACRSIFAYIEEHPAKAGQIRKFINYYLPTTMKLLNTYDRLTRQGVQGENISSTMFDIEAMMQTIATAFEKQLDNLFENEALDISTDISVLETMLQQEGLTGDEMDMKRG